MENIKHWFRRSIFFPTLFCALLLGAPLLSAAEQGSFGYHGATLEVAWRGEQALKLCNALFVSDRSLDLFYAQEMKNSRAAPCVPMPRERVQIDYQRKAVAIGVGDSKDLVPIMRAAYREGIGCVVMGVEQTFADIDKLIGGGTVDNAIGAPIATLGKAIENKNKDAFARAFDQLTAGCNSCHHTLDHAFIVIQRPEVSPFGNQAFAPK